MYRQVLDPVGHSLGLSSIFAVLPLVVLFLLIFTLLAWLLKKEYWKDVH